MSIMLMMILLFLLLGLGVMGVVDGSLATATIATTSSTSSTTARKALSSMPITSFCSNQQGMAFQTPNHLLFSYSHHHHGNVSTRKSTTTLFVQQPKLTATTSIFNPKQYMTSSLIKISVRDWMDTHRQRHLSIPQQSSTQLQASSTDTTTTSSSSTTTKSSTTTESKRLLKAKLLLEQFQQITDDVSAVGVVGTTSTTTKIKAEAVTTKSRITPGSRITIRTTTSTTTTPSTTDSDETIYDDMVFPDNVWRNDHLLTGLSSSEKGNGDKNIVTRWTRGANVAEPLVKYDPIAAERLLFRQPTKWVVRNFQIAVPLGWWAFNVVVDFLINRIFSTNDQEDNDTPIQKAKRRKVRAQQLTKAISSLGPAIIKGGQALASRPDLLPAEYLEELQTLQDDVPRFSNEVALRTVEQELQIQQFTDLFELIEEEPVAAASIGQVYKARLIENGDIVALKIQRPNCEQIVALDLYILRWWSGIYNQIIANFFKRDINLQSVIDDFGVLIYRELDYVAEASYAQRFNELYAGITPDVFVPKIYSDYTTSRVLTMEWVDGYRITDRKIMKALQLDERKLVNTLVQCSVRQILENGFFHADPHAGNLLACPDGRLCYLDFGMMSYANQKQRNGFLLAVVHVVNRDWSELAKLYVRLGFIPEGTDLQPIVVALEQALPDVLNADLTELNFKNVINSLGDVFYTFPFSLPPFYIAIIRCLGVLEGLAIQVDPSIKVLSECYPFVASRVLTDRQEDLQEAFRRLALTNDGKVRWERLEGLLEQATGVSDYNAAAALDLLTDYLVSEQSGTLVDDLALQLVEYIDNLNTEAAAYLVEALRAFSISDEVAAVRAFRSLSEIIQSQREEGLIGARKRVEVELRDGLPELTPSLKRLSTVVTLLLGTASNQPQQQKSKSQDPTKFVPIVRKLAASPKVQRAANEVMARLGERMLSRGLRAVFGLPPPPSFGLKNSATTVTEDKKMANQRS